jgi:HSP20 family protein
MSDDSDDTGVVGRHDPFEDFDLVGGWVPFRELGLGRLFDRSAPAAVRRWSPAVDVAEDDAAYVVTVELPGAKQEDIVVELHEGVLSIRGEKKSEREEERESSHWTERSYGSFVRSLRLPSNVVDERVDASLKQGVLTVRVPKAEETKPRVINVRSA